MVGIMKKDMVCGVQVDENITSHRSEYNSKTFYFCSPACKTRFDQRPEAYANWGGRIRQHASAVFKRPPPDSEPR
jgi:Cu+-exporting ATPase